MQRNLKKYQTVFKELESENTELEKKNKELTDKSKESLLKKLEIAQLRRDYEEAMEIIGRISPELLSESSNRTTSVKEEQRR